MESRKYFVEQVASTIVENHGKTDDSFIFGISGKWGEGKTRFLQDLEKEVKSRDETFEVLWVNPWKFASDKISFLRSFLGKLPVPNLNWFDRIRSSLRDPKELQDLYYDVTREVIDWRILIIFGLYLFLGLIFYLFGSKMYGVDWLIANIHGPLNTVIKVLAVSILVPIALAIFKSISTYQQGSKSISTVDRFEDLLTLRLTQNQGKKFLVYIDDLDRVTPTVARDVLDNLRTFFDKPDISFIVAGDHTVLERYIGRELLPGENQSAAQLEEGRRYLKKIFNVYWRLPPPISTELKKFIDDDLFAPSRDDLDKIFTGQNAATELQQFGSVLARYFDGNFRQIIRFFEMVRFTFQIIQKKRVAVTGDEKLYFDELIKYPLLVIRILLIQENCTPLFEAMLRDSEILLSLENAVEDKDTNKIKALLDIHNLSPNQRTFIDKFLFEEPRFFKDSSLVVSNLQPFLVFAADSSFGDGRGPSPEKFMEIVNRGNPDAVRQSIVSSGKPRLEEAANSFVSGYSAAPVGPNQISLLRTLVAALKEVPVSHNSQLIFGQKLQQIHLDFVNGISQADRVATYGLIWSWLDSLETEDKDLVAGFAGKFPAVNFDDFAQITFSQPIGVFSTARVIEWFKQFYAGQRSASYGVLLGKVDQLDAPTLSAELIPMEGEIVEDVIANRDGMRDSAYTLLLKMNRFDGLRARALERVQTFDQDFWNWMKAKNLSDLNLSQDDLEGSVISRLDKNPDDAGVVMSLLNFASGNGFGDWSVLWDKIVKTSINGFFANIAHYGSNPLYPITPDKATARALFSAVIGKITTLDESLQTQSLRWLRRDVWLWKNLDKPKDVKTLERLAKSPNADVAREATEVINSWNPSSSQNP